MKRGWFIILALSLGLNAGLLATFLNLIFGNDRNAIVETVEVFRGNAERSAERDIKMAEAALRQFAEEFAGPRASLFDRIIDGAPEATGRRDHRYFPGDDLLTPIERPTGLPIGDIHRLHHFLLNLRFQLFGKLIEVCHMLPYTGLHERFHCSNEEVDH